MIGTPKFSTRTPSGRVNVGWKQKFAVNELQ
jgi:hypothetical protein